MGKPTRQFRRHLAIARDPASPSCAARRNRRRIVLPHLQRRHSGCRRLSYPPNAICTVRSKVMTGSEYPVPAHGPHDHPPLCRRLSAYVKDHRPAALVAAKLISLFGLLREMVEQRATIAIIADLLKQIQQFLTPQPSYRNWKFCAPCLKRKSCCWMSWARAQADRLGVDSVAGPNTRYNGQ